MKQLIKKELEQIYLNYSNSIKNLSNNKNFFKNKMDPTNLFINYYFKNKSFDEILQQEIDRKINKTIQNTLGHFYEKILIFFPHCYKPNKKNIINFEKSAYKSFDLIYKKNNKITIVAEIKNKFNTTNSDSAKTIYERMLKIVRANKNVVCYLVEIISKKSQNIKWVKKINNKIINKEQIRKISIDRFIKIISKNILLKKYEHI